MCIRDSYSVDGWRLDVAADLGFSNEYNHKFWKEFRKNVKEANPEAIILAEHYGEARSWLQGDEWDTAVSYTHLGGLPGPFMRWTRWTLRCVGFWRSR